MRIKFQISILIIKNVGPSVPCQGRFPALGEVSLDICISLYYILNEYYAYQISTFYLNK